MTSCAGCGCEHVCRLPAGFPRCPECGYGCHEPETTQNVGVDLDDFEPLDFEEDEDEDEDEDEEDG